MTQSAPDLDEIKQLRSDLQPFLTATPMLRCSSLEDQLGAGTTVFGKMEFLQRTGTFKARGALAELRSLTDEQLERGVTAVSAGNHAIATAFAARECGTSAHVVMTASANSARVAACRGYGAEIETADDVHAAFKLVDEIKDREGRYFVHPFEGRRIAMGTGTLGLEICDQFPDVDVIVVAVGGGGLIGGIANAVKQVNPAISVIGVEAEGADTMHRSLASGKPESIDQVRTIADSLGSPCAMPYSLALCRNFVDSMVTVSDDDLRSAMRFLFEAMKIAVEPACAATTAALLGPLRGELQGKRIVLLYCGSNIDWHTFHREAQFTA